MTRSFSLVALSAALLCGCGGGGSSASTDPGGSVPTGPTNTFGPIETRGQVNGTPITRDLGQISTVALAGVLSDVTYRPQGKPDRQTAIAVAQHGEIHMVTESGEEITKWTPTLLQPGTTFNQMAWAPDGQTLYVMTDQPEGIYTISAANPTVLTPFILTTNLSQIALSPDGTKFSYSRRVPGETDFDVFERAVSGGATKRITTNDDVQDNGYIWTDNDHLAVFSSPPDKTQVVKVSDLSVQPYSPSTGAFPLARTADGTYLLNNVANDPSKGLSVTERVSTTGFGFTDFLDATAQQPFSASASPDGTRWAVLYYDNDTYSGIYTTELFPQTLTLVTPQTPARITCFGWQPALGLTTFVGAGGKLGTGAAGVIATRRTGSGRNGLASVVAWDATTRSTSTVSDDTSEVGSGAKTYTVEADRLTSMKFANGPLFTPVSVVTGTLNGAVVTVDGTSGVVEGVVTYQETRGSKPTVRREGDREIVEGHLAGVWDAQGQNLAPNGATRVVLDAKGLPSVG